MLCFSTGTSSSRVTDLTLMSCFSMRTFSTSMTDSIQGMKWQSREWTPPNPRPWCVLGNDWMAHFRCGGRSLPLLKEIPVPQDLFQVIEKQTDRQIGLATTSLQASYEIHAGYVGVKFRWNLQCISQSMSYLHLCRCVNRPKIMVFNICGWKEVSLQGDWVHSCWQGVQRPVWMSK